MTAMTLFTQLGLKQLRLDINNVGCFDCRGAFRQQLIDALTPYRDQLCEDCQRRLDKNPLRVLDCKVHSCQVIYQSEPIQKLIQGEHTCEACQSHYTTLLGLLDALGIAYQPNPMLVRGLDYYTRTVFEIVSMDLGAQNAVCGGGRYNGLVKSLGGSDVPAVGWALGVERLVSLIPTTTQDELDYFIASLDPGKALVLARELRQRGYSVECDLSDGKKALGKQLEQASKLNAKQVLILGESELASDQVSIKNLATRDQHTQPITALLASL